MTAEPTADPVWWPAGAGRWLRESRGGLFVIAAGVGIGSGLGAVAFRFAREARGHGVPEVMIACGMGAVFTSAARAPLTSIGHRRAPQAVYESESITETLRQLDAYGRDGLPVLSGDGSQVLGWITNASLLQAVAAKIGTSRQASPVTADGDRINVLAPVPARHGPDSSFDLDCDLTLVDAGGGEDGDGGGGLAGGLNARAARAEGTTANLSP